MYEEVPRATIGDVARHAGVSIATVSRVVNGRYGVAPTTFERVRKSITELGYEASLAARSLRNQTTNVIGILVPGIDPFTAELLKGAARSLRTTGYELVVYSGGVQGDDWELRYLKRLAGTLTDGTILVAPTVLQVAGTQPIVAIDPHVGGWTLPTIDSENFEGALAATEHLIGLGHRRIGFLAGRSDLESARLREDGYRAALDAAGLDFDAELIQVGEFTEETADAPARVLLGLTDRPTAIFAANDLSAIRVVDVARELGLDVPADLSVVGFDNIPESALTDPPLTTVDQSLQQLGGEAVRVLIDLIEHPEHHSERKPVRVTLPTRLVLRQSCAALDVASNGA